MQATLAKSVTVNGTGLHTGRPVRAVLHPAAPGTGIVFERVDVSGADRLLPARWDLVDQTPLCTRLVNADGVEVSTIEHLMAAFAGLGIVNVRVAINGPEVPILDGSAAPFARKMLAVGRVFQSHEREVLRILKPVEVRRGEAVARLEPANGFLMDFEIEFDAAAIGRQRRSIDLANGAFVRTLCDSRTFCRSGDVAAMRAQGLAKGGTLENAVVFDGDEVLSPGGLRHADEPVRHKMLDALGDLSLAGYPILGRYVGVRAGHAMTNRLLRAVFADPDAYAIAPCAPHLLSRLPGVGVHRGDLAACA